MNVPAITLNARKRFLYVVAMAVVFVILASGADALANTVWCVTKTSYVPNPACTPSTTFSTISAVLGLTSSPGPVQQFDVMVVAPGYYNESVEITVSNLSIFGAQAGRDARVDRWNPANESVVDATNQESLTFPGGGGAAFFVEGSNVVIDGFTIQGGGVATTNPLGAIASGMYVVGEGAQILNNITQNNALGVFLGSGSLVQHNLFKTNNAGKVGAGLIPFAGMAGFGIAGLGASGAAITENKFEGNWAAAMDFLACIALEVTKNTSEKDGAFAVVSGTGSSFLSQNQGRDFRPKAPLPLTGPPQVQADAAIDVGEASFLQINDNDLEDGRTTGYSGIAFTTVFPGGYYCVFCQVSNNRISRFAGNGIMAEASSGSGTLTNSGISGNDVKENGNVGILIEESTGNSGNTVVANEVRGNDTNDCEDDSYLTSPSPPVGTAGTINTWFNNIGSLSLPAGLCTPGRGHHHDRQ